MRLDLIVGPNGAGKSIASETRNRLIDAGLPFVAETVFSHPSELDLVRHARRAGYVVSIHVVLVTEDLAVTPRGQLGRRQSYAPSGDCATVSAPK